MPKSAENSPYFTIVIPVYNRARLIGRALGSCLGQDWEDLEVIVVNDGSTDETQEAVRCYHDPRVRLISHEINRGVCAARNTGAAAARGNWILFLDSDDELLSGALRRIRNRIGQVGPEIKRVTFMYQLDTGELSPDPPLRDETWNYERYIRWASVINGPSDFLNVINRATFDTVRFPDGKAVESLFHLDFGARFLTQTWHDVVGIVHSDASNRSKDVSVDRLMAEAADNAAVLTKLLLRHGPALQRWGPSTYFNHLRGLATSLFLAGRRSEGIRIAARHLRQRISAKVLVIMVLGFVGPVPLAWLKIRMSALSV